MTQGPQRAAGRLATYKYLDMDDVILSALETVDDDYR